MKQLFTLMIMMLGSISVLAQTQPANVCTSKLEYNFDEEITWYYDLSGSAEVSAGDDLYFYSWAPSHDGGSLLLTYESDMIWSLTWTPTEYFDTDAATIEALDDGAFWHNLTLAGGGVVTGTVDYSLNVQFINGTGCNCLLPAKEDTKYLFNFAGSSAAIEGEDSNRNYWTNVTANNSSYDIVTTTNGSYYEIATSGGFVPNTNSDFTTPDSEKLGDLAISNATKSYLYLSGTSTGTATLSCLDKEHTYKLSILGSRATASTRETKYTVTGSTTEVGTIQTSGTSLGSTDCTSCNDDELYEVEMTPDVNGEISILVEIVTGGFAYINAMLVEETAGLIWSSSAWSNIAGPSASSNVVLNDDYTTGTSGALEVADLIVNEGNTLTVSTGTSLIVHGDIQNEGSIVVESGASLLTYEGQSFSGNEVIIKRNTRYAGGKYSFVGSPVVQNASTTGADLGTWVYAYDESVAYGADGADRWVDANAEELTAGKGYAQAGQQELIFIGTPNNGSITYAGSYTDRTDGNDGWNLVANPYAAAIGYDAFMEDNTNNTGSLYIWDDNGSDEGRGSNSDYIVVNASGNTDSNAGSLSNYNGYIGSAQAFFIKLDGAGDNNVVFEEDQRSTGNNADANFFRNADQVQRLRINLTSNDGLFKQTLLAWNEDVDDQKINRLYDAAVFNASAENAIYTMKLGESLAIQTITSGVKEIPLGVNVSEAGAYHLTFDVSEFDQDIYLKDNLLNELVRVEEAYSFTAASAGKLSDRFELLTVMSILSAEMSQEWKIYTSDQNLYIHPVENSSSTFNVYSISGQFIMSAEVDKPMSIQMNVKPGIYIVSNGSFSQKVILK